MNVTFLSDNPLNSTVVDLDGGAHLYNIATQYESDSVRFRSTTTLRGPENQLVAVWKRAHPQDKDKGRITYHGKMHTLADWLPKKSSLSSTRMLVGPDGERYHWKQKTGWGATTLKLIDPETSRTIAQVRSARTGRGLLSKDRRMGLVVQPEATPLLDVIVLSFVVLETTRREQGYSAAGGTSLAAARIASGVPVVV